jgi:trimeric autotransporter adhesin
MTARAAPFAFAVNQGPKTVSAFTVNTTTGVLTAVAGAGSVTGAGADPVGASVDSTGRFVYVPNFSSGNLSAYTINAASGALTAIDANTALAGVQNFATGTNPAGVAIDPTGKFVYVTNFGAGTVSAYSINQTTGFLTSVGAAVAAGTNPNFVSIDPTGKFVYVANYGASSVSAYTINQTTGALTSVGAAVAAGTNPGFVSIDPTGKFAYVSNFGSSNVSAYSINQTTGALTVAAAALATGTNPRSVNVDPSGKFVYTANIGSNNVSAYSINQTTGALTALAGAGGTVATETGPTSISFDPDGKFAYVANIASSSVTVYTINAVSGVLTAVAGAAGRVATGDPRFFVVGPNLPLPPPPPPPPAPSVPAALNCTASTVVAGTGSIDCTFAAASASDANPVQSYRLYCTNDTASIALQMTVTATQTRATISNAIAGRYACTVTAQGLTSASQPSSSALVALSATPLALNNHIDMDGSGLAAIVLRAGTPATSLVGRFDGTKFNFTPATDVGAGWSVLGAGDVTGRNRSSLISRNDTDDVRIDTNGISTLLRQAKSDWSLEAVTDLDGDGKADLVWRYMKPGSNDSGVIFAWYMDGAPTINAVRHRGGAPLSWSLIGGADIDGDGRGDLIWLSPGNEIRSLTSKANRTWVNERIAQLPAGYSIQKLADFNADGKGDMVFKDATGRVKMWMMNGTSIALDADMPTVAATTAFFAAGDFDGDGSIDIVWKKADGTLTLWLMNRAVTNQPTIIDNAGQAPTGVVVE